MTDNLLIPKWFKVITSLAIVWNLMGVMAFFMGPAMNDSALSALTETERNLYLATPFWATAAFAIAVIVGFLGSIALLLRKLICKLLLVISLAAIIVQMFHAYFISNSWQVLGPEGAVLPIMIIIFAVYLVNSSFQAQHKGWLN
ncbi:hypothetical protein AADZ86_01385 [Colwelliaceae bacterium BS250]